MGAASNLFHSNDSEKQTLHRRIIPSEEQIEEQQERWNLLAEHLTAELSAKSGYSLRTWLQGSYKLATQIRPVHLGDEFDIDLGVYYEWEGDATDGDYDASELKNFVQEA